MKSFWFLSSAGIIIVGEEQYSEASRSVIKAPIAYNYIVLPLNGYYDFRIFSDVQEYLKSKIGVLEYNEELNIKIESKKILIASISHVANRENRYSKKKFIDHLAIDSKKYVTVKYRTYKRSYKTQDLDGRWLPTLSSAMEDKRLQQDRDSKRISNEEYEKYRLLQLSKKTRYVEVLEMCITSEQARAPSK